MTAKDNPYLEGFRKSLLAWTDHRMVSQEDLWAMAMFNLYLVNLASEDGWEYYGHSFKNSAPLAILVVKATMDGLPVVVFTSGRDAMGCVRIFVRKLEQGLLEWSADKFR